MSALPHFDEQPDNDFAAQARSINAQRRAIRGFDILETELRDETLVELTKQEKIKRGLLRVLAQLNDERGYVSDAMSTVQAEVLGELEDVQAKIAARRKEIAV